MTGKYWIEPSRRPAYEAGFYDEKGFATNLPPDHPILRYLPPGIEDVWYMQKSYTAEFQAVLSVLLEVHKLTYADMITKAKVTTSDPYHSRTRDIEIELWFILKNAPDKQYMYPGAIDMITIVNEQEFKSRLGYLLEGFAQVVIREFRNNCKHQFKPLMIELFPGRLMASSTIGVCKFCGEHDYV